MKHFLASLLFVVLALPQPAIARSRVDTSSRLPRLYTRVEQQTLSIPRLGLWNVPARDTDVFDELASQMVMQHGLGHAYAAPGEPGCAVYFGHSSPPARYRGSAGSILKNIGQLQIGDNIIANDHGFKYVYTVTSTRIIHPDEVDALSCSQHGEEALALFSCWPIGTSTDRLFIYASRTHGDLR